MLRARRLVGDGGVEEEGVAYLYFTYARHGQQA
jgi:hypothetical protein